MSSPEENQKKFEIIKCLWATVAIRKKSSATFEDITKDTGLSDNEIRGIIRILHNAGFVKSTYVSLGNFNLAYLTEKSFSVMEKSPQPTSYEELQNRIDNPQTIFGEHVKLSDETTGGKVKKGLHLTYKSIIAIGSIATAILAIYGVYASGILCNIINCNT